MDMSAYASGTHLVTNVHVEPLAVNSEVDLVLLISQFRMWQGVSATPNALVTYVYFQIGFDSSTLQERG